MLGLESVGKRRGKVRGAEGVDKGNDKKWKWKYTEAVRVRARWGIRVTGKRGYGAPECGKDAERRWLNKEMDRVRRRIWRWIKEIVGSWRIAEDEG